MDTKQGIASLEGALPVANEVSIADRIGCVDWLTLTSKAPEMRERMRREAKRLKEMGEQAGDVTRPWGMKGYRGYIVGSVRWGTRPLDDILMLSGQAAQVNWQAGLDLADNVSRVDLACTLTLAEPLYNVALDAYRDAWDAEMKTGVHKRKYSYVENSAGGQTCYVGSRASDQFGRLYDKGCELADQTIAPPGTLWRYEVEFKDYRAARVAEIISARAKATKACIGYDIQLLVHEWFRARLIEPIWQSNEGRPWTLEIEAHITDDEVILKWLTHQVQPSVQRLMDRGKRDEVLRALGITVVSEDQARRSWVRARREDGVVATALDLTSSDEADIMCL